MKIVLNILAVVFVVGLVIFVSSGCINPQQNDGAVVERGAEKGNLTTDTRSEIFAEKQEKLDFLKKYLMVPSEVIDTEYHIIYWDNSTGITAGPSDWDIRAAFRVEEEDVPLWTTEMKRILPEQLDMKLWDDLKSDTLTWEDTDYFEYFKRPDSQSYIAVNSERNIILKFISTLGISFIDGEGNYRESVVYWDMSGDDIHAPYTIHETKFAK